MCTYRKLVPPPSMMSPWSLQNHTSILNLLLVTSTAARTASFPQCMHSRPLPSSRLTPPRGVRHLMYLLDIAQVVGQVLCLDIEL